MRIAKKEYTEVKGTGDDVTNPTPGLARGGLSVIFAVMCIIDLFGVFPVVALPKSVISCGVYGIPLVLSVIGLQLYTAVLLGRCWLLAQEITPNIREKNRYPYAAVGELAFGRVGRRTVTILLNATVFGSGIPNFILAAQSLQLFWWKMTDGGVAVSYCVWMLVLAVLLCPVMWLGSPKDMKYVVPLNRYRPLAVSSVLIVSTVAVAIWTCISLDDVSPVSAGSVLSYRPQMKDFLSAYGILAFQFDIHPMLLTIQVDMRDSRQINKAMAGGFIVTLLMFTVTAVLAAQRYGMDVDNNILQGIPPSIPLYVVALLVTLQLCLSSAVGNSVLFQQIEDYCRIPRNFCWQRILVRSSIVFLAVFLAESVPRFDLVMGLVGSTLTGPLMFIFPPIFFLKLCYIKTQLVNKDPLKLGKRLTYQNDPNDYDSQNGDGSQNGGNNGYQNGGHNGHQNGGQDCYQNGGTNGYQNGGHSEHGSHNGIKNGDETPLILEHSMQKYKAFNRYYRKIYADTDDDYTIIWYDVIFALIVMTLGIAATIVATYSSWANSIQYASYSPPCLVNASIAARSFLEAPFQ